MVDETTTQDTQEANSGAPQTGDATGTNGGQEGAAKAFSQADVDRMIAERLKREQEKTAKAADAARAEAERKAAEEQGKFKELYDAAQAKLAAAETKTKELELATLKRAAAEKVGLPGALAERLRGETPEELEADAKQVLAALPKPAAPDINNRGGGDKGSGKNTEAMKQFESWVRRI